MRALLSEVEVVDPLTMATARLSLPSSARLSIPSTIKIGNGNDVNEVLHLQFFYNEGDATRSQWIPYPHEINQVLCECVEKREKKQDMDLTVTLLSSALEFQVGNALFIVDLESMVQINKASGSRCQVCFVERAVDDADEAFEASEFRNDSATTKPTPMVSFDDYHTTWANLATTKRDRKILKSQPPSKPFPASLSVHDPTTPQRLWYPSHSTQPTTHLLETSSAKHHHHHHHHHGHGHGHGHHNDSSTFAHTPSATVSYTQHEEHDDDNDDEDDLLDFVNTLDEDLL